MPCHQQLGCTEAGDAAAEIICREHGGAKKLLVDTLPHKAFAFQTLFRQFVFVNFREVLKSLPGKLSAQALTFERERFGVAVEFVPDLFLTLCPMRHAANSTRSLLWIKAGEISKFVRNRTNAAAQKFGELDYLRIIDVNGPERDFAIQVERENVFLACPVSVASDHNLFQPIDFDFVSGGLNSGAPVTSSVLRSLAKPRLKPPQPQNKSMKVNLLIASPTRKCQGNKVISN